MYTYMYVCMYILFPWTSQVWFASPHCVLLWPIATCHIVEYIWKNFALSVIDFSN
jgi:hypothetical protein